MFKILHAHPSNHNPHPAHHRRQHHQRRIIPDNRQGGIVLKLRRRIRRRAYIPRPTPHAEAGSHAHYEHEPCHDQNDVAPPLGLGVVPCAGRIGGGRDGGEEGVGGGGDERGGGRDG